MYTNVKIEMVRNNLTQVELSKKMKMSLSTLSSKLTGKTPFTVNEAKLLKSIVNSDLAIDELFKEAQ